MKSVKEHLNEGVKEFKKIAVVANVLNTVDTPKPTSPTPPSTTKPRKKRAKIVSTPIPAVGAQSSPPISPVKTDDGYSAGATPPQGTPPVG